MMKIDINLNDVQTMLMDFAKAHGMAEAQVHEEWAVDYRIDGHLMFEKRLTRLLEAMQLYKEALAREDGITAVCALSRACTTAGLISDDFEALEEDLLRAIRLDETAIPEDYKIPEHYGFSQR